MRVDAAQVDRTYAAVVTAGLELEGRVFKNRASTTALLNRASSAAVENQPARCGAATPALLVGLRETAPLFRSRT